MSALTPPIKWHGGKHYLAPKIVALMPPRCKNPNKPADDDPGWLHYVEPYVGGGAVLLANDPDGISEVANDLNGELTNFWQVLAHPLNFNRFERIVEATPFSESAFEQAAKSQEELDKLFDSRIPGAVDRVGRAVRFFIHCRQSLSGRMKGFAGITRNRTRKGMNEQVSAWLNCIEGLPAVHARLQRVLILNRPAIDVIRSEDGPRTLFYLDPPYLHETRTTTKEYGEHEMTMSQHFELLVALSKIKGRFLLSGYQSAMYDAHATERSWKCHTFDLPNNSAGGKEKRRMTECVWCNF